LNSRRNSQIEQDIFDITLQLDNTNGLQKGLKNGPENSLADSLEELTHASDWKLKTMPRRQFQQRNRAFAKER
jgi:hypothetical protein